MKASLLYRVTAVLLLLFATLHTIGFRQDIPEWHAGAVTEAMRATRFDAQGVTRSYWDFYTSFGLLFSVFLLLSAVLAWQLGGLRSEAWTPFARTTAWALAICFAVQLVVGGIYSFTTPNVFAAVVTVCLVAAAWLAPTGAGAQR